VKEKVEGGGRPGPARLIKKNWKKGREGENRKRSVQLLRKGMRKKGPVLQKGLQKTPALNQKVAEGGGSERFALADLSIKGAAVSDQCDELGRANQIGKDRETGRRVLRNSEKTESLGRRERKPIACENSDISLKKTKRKNVYALSPRHDWEFNQRLGLLTEKAHTQGSLPEETEGLELAEKIVAPGTSSRRRGRGKISEGGIKTPLNIAGGRRNPGLILL